MAKCSWAAGVGNSKGRRRSNRMRMGGRDIPGRGNDVSKGMEAGKPREVLRAAVRLARPEPPRRGCCRREVTRSASQKQLCGFGSGRQGGPWARWCRRAGRVKEPGLRRGEVLRFIRCMHVRYLPGWTDGTAQPQLSPTLASRASQRQEVPPLYRSPTL